MTTRTIRGHIAPVADVARLFAGSPYDILVERLQCARRAGATRVSLITSANDDGTTSVRVLDDSLAAPIAACGWTTRAFSDQYAS